MKPFVRYTVGSTTSNGILCLIEGVRQFSALYPECVIVVCYNQLTHKQLGKLRTANITLVNQEEHIDSLSVKPIQGYNVHWKLYPPRLSIDTHELFIDNDIVLTRRLDKIDRFLQGQHFLLYQGLHGLYGNYPPLLQSNIKINSGVFGLPPHYDWKQDLVEYVADWNDPFDEQGLVARLIAKPVDIISQIEIPIIETNHSLKAHDTNMSCCGYHFVGLNRSEAHIGFMEYRNRKVI